MKYECHFPNQHQKLYLISKAQPNTFSYVNFNSTFRIGTAGYTAMLCVDALKKGGVDPNAGEVLVTGASGGVGTVALALLSELGYKVAAVTGKADPDVAELLTKLGASSIVARSNFEADAKPLAKETYVGAVDTVGGNVLTNIITMVSYTTHCLKITQNVSFEFFNFGIFHQFLSY